MNRHLIRRLVRLAISVGNGEEAREEAAQVIADLPRCRAPGCGVVLYTNRLWCSISCRSRAPRDLPAARLRLAATEPLTTYSLEDE